MAHAPSRHERRIERDHSTRPCRDRRDYPEELVFTTSRSTSPTAWALWCALADATTKAGVRPIRTHDLRHACATLLLAAGEELAATSKALGRADHSSAPKAHARLGPQARRGRGPADRRRPRAPAGGRRGGGLMASSASLALLGALSKTTHHGE